MPEEKLISVNEATHVIVDGKAEKIATKWGINSEGGLAKPSEGGFGVVTEIGRRVGMMEAQSYLREEGELIMARGKLTKIPKSVQDTYSIGSEVNVEIDSSVGGGNFKLTNLKGKEMSIDAVELSGTGILVETFT